MPLRLTTLYAAALREAPAINKTVTEARAKGAKTVFLCHSHKDASLVKGLITLLAEAGWSAYVDWQDTQMPPVPNRDTARRIQERIAELDIFLYLATPHSAHSRWCPWEIGFANGKKPIDNIIVCPTTDGATVHGAEYLQLYRQLDFSDSNQLAVWRPGESQSGIRLPYL